MSVLICVPTLSGREPYLVNAIRSIAERTPEDWNISLVRDAPSAGVGWNRCAERLCFYPETEYLWFANDDICVATGWLPPLIEAVQQGCVPAMRIEPAGGHIGDEIIFQTHPPMAPDYYPVPRNKMAYFYSDLQENQPQEDWKEVPHGNLPFCSVEQWREIGEFPPFHYGSDTWFYHRARRIGCPVVARLDSVAFNYNANIGRSKGDWTEQDFLDFDGIVALPAYLSGELEPHEEHPQRLTPEGLTRVREWRAEHVANQEAEAREKAGS